MSISLELLEVQSDDWIIEFLVKNGSDVEINRANNMYGTVKILNEGGELKEEDSLYYNNDKFEILYKMDRDELARYIEDGVFGLAEQPLCTSGAFGKEIREGCNNSKLMSVEEYINGMTRIEIMKSTIDNFNYKENEGLRLSVVYLSSVNNKLYNEYINCMLLRQIGIANSIYYNDNLPCEIIKRMKAMLEWAGVRNITEDDINRKWEELYNKDTDEIDELDKIIIKVVDILKSEIKWVNELNGDGCEKWAVVSTLGRCYYGSVIVFNNKNSSMGSIGKEGLSIQEINKSIPALIINILYPEIGRNMPKLNTILEDGIVGVANFLGLKYIYVKPYINQAKILKKYYGYEKINNYGYLYDGIKDRNYHEINDKKLKWPCEIKYSMFPWMRKKIS